MFKILIRLVAIYLTCWWIYNLILIRIHEDGIRLNLIPASLAAIVLGCLINLGLWFSTIKFGKQHKYFTMSLIIPSLFVSLFFAPGYRIFSFFCIIIIYVLAIILIFKK